VAFCSFDADLPIVQLYELETAYLSAEHSQCGTVLKVRRQSSWMHTTTQSQWQQTQLIINRVGD
jgi:hypothetical protein